MRRFASLPISPVASCVAGAEYDVPRSKGHRPPGTQPCAASAPDSVAVTAPQSQAGEVPEQCNGTGAHRDARAVRRLFTNIEVDAVSGRTRLCDGCQPDLPAERTPLAWPFRHSVNHTLVDAEGKAIQQPVNADVTVPRVTDPGDAPYPYAASKSLAELVVAVSPRALDFTIVRLPRVLGEDYQLRDSADILLGR
jgi:hypothetical protein